MKELGGYGGGSWRGREGGVMEELRGDMEELRGDMEEERRGGHGGGNGGGEKGGPWRS